MAMSTTHFLRRTKRGIFAAFLTFIYLTLQLSPLVSLALNSNSALPALTLSGECTGDCNQCGCSPESRASNTCCCSKKRQQAHAHEDEDKGTAGCENKPVKKKTVIACGCPCGSSKQSALKTTEVFEVPPLHCREQFNIPPIDTLFMHQQHRLTSRHTEPPDPPPKHS